MDIGLSIALRNHSQIQDGATLMVLKKAMDATEDNSATMVQMLQTATKTMELSVNPHIGNKIDIRL